MLFVLCQRMGLQYKPNSIIKDLNYNLIIERANGENLQYQNGKFDCYIANLCLQITTNPENMISEAYRVLESGGHAGFTVWGDKKRSQLFTLAPSILNKQFGVNFPKIRSNFHLNDKNLLIKMLEDQGFTNIICWNQFQPFPFVNSEDLKQIFDHPIIKDLLAEVGEKKDDAKIALQNAFKKLLFKKKNLLGQMVL